MPQNYPQHREKATENSVILSNVKKSRQYDRFGEYVRYFTIDEFQLFTDAIDRQEHKLMMFLIPLSGTGCRVGEFVQIRLKHLDFLNSAVFFPAANTKTKHQRSSHIPRGLMNDIVMYLRGQNRMAKRTYRVFDGEDFLFRPHHRKRVPYTTNRIRQIFQHYVRKAGLDREYGADTRYGTKVGRPAQSRHRPIPKLRESTFLISSTCLTYYDFSRQRHNGILYSI